MRICYLTLTAVIVASTPVFADPLPEQILKFQQLPLNLGLPVIAPYTGPFVAPNPFSFPGTAGYPTPFAPFPGHDELSTAFANEFNPATGEPLQWQGTFMADDFADRFTTPVIHVRWWGSYLGNQFAGGVQNFLISFESDIPAGTGGIPFSRPGTPLLNQIVTKATGPLTPASGTFTEALLTPPGPGVPEALFQYNAELALPFPQLPDTVYWLKIVALVDPSREQPFQWGWHNRDWAVPDLEASIPPGVIPGEGVIGAVGPGSPVWHFQDDAVSGSLSLVAGADLLVLQTGFAPQNYIDGIDGPTGISQFSKDLAFELYTIPEPATLLILGLASAFLGLRRRTCT